ncbi:DNA glycosylase AlkZ-like family protein [Halomonas sp. HG01]|uniref:DNA glycosylase AlkZ-like family protein n=1 Tax=Halomonas sp. HG01 TaxID=1609967 RepID=UPI0006149823|nr:crosslink repair DNA glycosylase YcaQ family protein [Halomonas sp. HG01]
MKVFASQDDLDIALENEIREILGRAADPLTLTEIYAHTTLAEGRHSVASRVSSMAQHGALVTHPHGDGRRYSLPMLAQGEDVAPPTTIKGRVEAHLAHVGKPLSLRQIADNLRLDRKAVTRALNALGRADRVAKIQLERGRVAWQTIDAERPVPATPEPVAPEQAQPSMQQLIADLRQARGGPSASLETSDEAAAEPVFALASDGSLTLCAHETELLLDADETEALMAYLAPWVISRHADRRSA